MEYRLRVLMIVLAVMICIGTGVYFVVRYARPMVEAASDLVAELGVRAVYRGGCNATFD